VQASDDRIQPVGQRRRAGLQDQRRLDLDNAVVTDGRNLVPAPRMGGANGSRECAPDDKLRDTRQLHLMEMVSQAQPILRTDRATLRIFPGFWRGIVDGKRQIRRSAFPEVRLIRWALYLYEGNKDTLYCIHGTNQPE